MMEVHGDEKAITKGTRNVKREKEKENVNLNDIQEALLQQMKKLKSETPKFVNDEAGSVDIRII